MKVLKITTALLCLGLIVSACSKNNKAAKNIDGTYSFDSWSWDGSILTTADELSGSDTLGIWTFNTCKTSKDDCDGSQTGFLGLTTNETFEWRIEDKGESIVFGNGSQSTGASANQLSGKWDIVTLNDSKLVATSSTCGTCQLIGKSTITFTKN